jgi:hypothetical protein
LGFFFLLFLPFFNDAALANGTSSSILSKGDAAGKRERGAGSTVICPRGNCFHLYIYFIRFCQFPVIYFIHLLSAPSAASSAWRGTRGWTTWKG